MAPRSQRTLPQTAFLFLFVLAGLCGCADRGPRSLLEGERLIQEGKYPDATAKLKEAVDLLPQNPQAWNHLGLAYHHAGQSSKAMDAYQNALRLDRANASAHFNLGCVLLENNFAMAADSFANYSRLKPNDVNGWIKLGTAQLRQARRLSGNEKTRWLEAAKRNLDVSLKIRPTAEAFTTLGVIEVERQQAREAIKHFTAALQQEPSYPAALFNLAVVYHNSNDRRLALQKYREFLAAQPRSSRFRQVEEIARALDSDINPPVITNTVTRPLTGSANAPKNAGRR